MTDLTIRPEGPDTFDEAAEQAHLGYVPVADSSLWHPEDADHPYVDGLPLMAWIAWRCQGAGAGHEDPIVALLFEVSRLANRDREYLRFLIVASVRRYEWLLLSGPPATLPDREKSSSNSGAR